MPPSTAKQSILYIPDPFFHIMEKTLQAYEGERPKFIFDDREINKPDSPWLSLNNDLLACLTDRSRFREFTHLHSLSTPTWKTAKTLEELGNWIMKHKKFPLALKSWRNASNGAGVFRLEGFRELNGFYEKIQTFERGPVIVEDWIEAQALIEISISGGGNTLMTQVGLDRTLLARWKWRMFPINIPSRYKAGIDNIMAAFKPFLHQKGTIFRITVALLGGGETVPISISGSVNRMEYFPGWCENAGVPPLITSLFSPVDMNLKPSTLVRLQFFRGYAKALHYPSQLPEKAAKLGVIKYAAAGRHAAALLAVTQPSASIETVKLLAQILEEEAADE